MGFIKIDAIRISHTASTPWIQGLVCDGVSFSRLCLIQTVLPTAQDGLQFPLFKRNNYFE